MQKDSKMDSGEDFTEASFSKPAVCECGAKFVMNGVRILGKELWLNRYCEPCIERKVKEKEEAERKEKLNLRMKEWEDVCPPLYRQTDLSRLRIDPTTADQVLGWVWGPEGLLLAGESRKGKTRLMFKLLERLFVHEGRGVMYLNSTTLSDKIASLYSESAKAADDYITKLEYRPVLFIDDIGKGRFTDRAESVFYRILETRQSHMKPTFFTCNCSATELKNLLSTDRGEPIINRIREMTQTIVL